MIIITIIIVISLFVSLRTKLQHVTNNKIHKVRERRALDEEETGQDLSHRYYWTRFQLSWLTVRRKQNFTYKNVHQRFCMFSGQFLTLNRMV